MEPLVVMYGSDHRVIEDVICEMTGEGDVRPATLSEHMTGYRWRIDNKYYTADVQLCLATQKQLPDELLADRCQAVVIFFNSDQVEGLDWADSVHAFSQYYQSDVCMLVCNTCHEHTPVSRLKAQQWCVSRGFELIELTPADPVDPDDDFPETTGVARIVQALHAHTWSNLVMKERGPPQPSNKTTNEVAAERDGSVPDDEVPSENDSAPVNNEANSPHNEAAPPDNDAALHINGDAVGISSGDVDDVIAGQDCCEFDDLLSRLTDMRTEAERLPRDQRHLYAERVALQFWKAMGGDKEEDERGG